MTKYYAAELDGFFTFFTDLNSARAYGYKLIEQRPWVVVPIYKVAYGDDALQSNNLVGAVFPLPDGSVVYYSLDGMYLSEINADGGLAV